MLKVGLGEEKVVRGKYEFGLGFVDCSIDGVYLKRVLVCGVKRMDRRKEKVILEIWICLLVL